MTERDDYKTILTNHTFANNANLTSEPAIHLVSDSLASSSKGNGVIEIGEFRRIQVEETYNTRHTTFAVAHKISFRGQTTDTKIQALIEEIQNACDGRIKTAYGIGTNLTNDVGVKPLNIVIKMTSFSADGKMWKPVVKLSDDAGKHTGSQAEVELCKRILGVG